MADLVPIFQAQLRTIHRRGKGVSGAPDIISTAPWGTCVTANTKYVATCVKGAVSN
jgi:hypothetical protein